MENIINWVKAHNFKYKIIENVIFWRTNYQTIKFDTVADTMEFLNWKIFEEI